MRSRVLRTLAVAALVVVALEGVVRLHGDRIRDGLDWYHRRAQVLAQEMEVVHEAGIRSDLTFVGTSQVAAAVHIPIVEERLATVTYAHNAGIPAAQTPVVEAWLFDRVVPLLQPDRVVWAVSSLDFNGNRPDKTLDAYREGRAVETGFLASVDRFLGSISELSQRRILLRSPANWVRLFDPDHFDAILDPEGHPPDPPPEDLVAVENVNEEVNRGERIGRRMREEVLVDYAIGDEEAAAFRDGVRALQRRGVEVVVVLVPVPQRYVASHPNGADDLNAFREWIAAEAGRLGVPLFDHTRAMPNRSFRDYTHLLPDGAEEYTGLLAADLATLGW